LHRNKKFFNTELIIMQKRVLFLMSMLLMFSLTAMAQITTSSLTGKVVVEGANESAIGATVQAVHEPSGTRYAAVTNASGRFTIQGMRTGGPYTVTISYIGFQSKSLKNITLELGETFNVNAVLSENASELGEVIVSGKASKFATEKTGASTNINNATLTSIPTVTREINDITRISPYANGMSFGGANGRMSNFTLDGANLNNNFGLSANLPGGGTPVSVDAIDEVQVVVSPFDVRQSNFIGGGINAITKSGTNLFKGTAYVYHTNENMHGNRVDDQSLADPGKDRKTTYGFTLGGPIVKNKLFFFANYEQSIVPTTPNRWRGSDDGVADTKNNISRTKLSDLQQVSDYVASKYGYDTGSWTDFPADEKNTKYLVRLDWNINQNHHFMVRFNHTNNEVWNAPTSSYSDFNKNFDKSTEGRFSQSAMSYENSMYKQQNKVTTISSSLNSRFTKNLSNELLFTYSDIDDVRDSNSSKFPFVDIYEPDANGTPKPYISLGYEFCTPGNRVRNKITTITDNVTYYLGSHKLMAGASWEHQVAYNTFLRRLYGIYAYNSVNDFLTGATPDNVGLTWGYNGVAEPTEQVTFNQLGVYLQDEWNALERLKLTFGVRFDNMMFDNGDLMANNAIDALDYAGTHLTTGEWPKSHVSISPRFGFVWDVFGDKSLKVRGGSGLFVGRLPLVFFTNMPGSTGMSKYQYSSAGDAYRTAVLAGFTGGLKTNPDEMRDIIVANNPNTKITISPEDGVVPSSLSAVDKNFKMPQVWKSSIAIDYNFPVSFPLSITGEFTYTKVINDVYLEDISVKGNSDGWDRLIGADNRIVYPMNNRLTYNDVSGKEVNIPSTYYLTNTNQGYGYTANVTLNAEPVKNLRMMAAYTYTKMKELSSMPGSTAASVLQAMYAVNGPRFADLQSTSFVLPHRIIANVSYDYNKEHFSLFYEGCASNTAYSYYYSGDLNGDGQKTDLMYIPANDNEIQFATEADRLAFWRYVDQDDYLKNHKGEYAGAYDVHTPMVHRFDFRYAHDFTFCLGKTRHKLQLSADVKNIGNLLNSKWGVFKRMINGGQLLNVVDPGWKDDKATGKRIVYSAPKFSVNKVNGEYPTETWEYISSYGQCWQIQVGAKYYFDQLTDEESDRLCKPCREEISQMDIDKLNAMVAERDAENARLKAEVAALQAESKAEVKPEVKIVEKEVQIAKVVTAPTSVFFNSGKATIASKKELENVKEVARVARENNAKIVVTGYADSKTGNAELNKRLSQQRAETVANQLVAMGVSRDNIEIVAAGGVDDLNPYNYNRRVTVILK
jgi:outer membrane protein OmpA-like peptidoglycan-associated protein